MGRAVPTVAYSLDRRPMEHVRAGDVGVPADPVGSFVQIELEYSKSESGKSSDIHASEIGGGAAVPHLLNDLGGPAAPPDFFLACHWLLQIQFLSENELTWHDQISNHTARNWRFPGLSAISAITIETKKSLNESDRFRTPHRRTLTVWWVARLRPSVARLARIWARRRRSPGTGFRSLARSLLSVLAAGGGGRWRLGDGVNLLACRRGQ